MTTIQSRSTLNDCLARFQVCWVDLMDVSRAINLKEVK
jgi:hypothetical protein